MSTWQYVKVIIFHIFQLFILEHKISRFTLKGLHDKYQGSLSGDVLIAEGTPDSVVQALVTVLDVDLTQTISPQNYLRAMRTIFTPNLAEIDNQIDVDNKTLASCSVVQVWSLFLLIDFL